MALQILDWSWEWGWDEEHGGIINFRDCRNFPAQDYSQDMKFGGRRPRLLSPLFMLIRQLTMKNTLPCINR